jgi:acyl-coenzyme A thioesterase PaaI-like protein
MKRLDSPYAHAMGISACADTDGRELLLLRFGTHLLGRPGFLHGGAIAGFLSLVCDHALADAALAEGEIRFRCLTSTFQFLRGGRELDVRGGARIQRGTVISTVNALAWQDDEAKPIAVVTRRYLMD